MFLVAVPIAGLAFLASWLIPQVELKRWPEAGPTPPQVEMPVADTTGAPEVLAPGPLAADAAQPATAPSADAGIRARE